MKDKVLGLGKLKRVSKSPWKCKIRKWAKDAQGERNGPKEPTNYLMG